jgi:hypothetical protein
MWVTSTTDAPGHVQAHSILNPLTEIASLVSVWVHWLTGLMISYMFISWSAGVLYVEESMNAMRMIAQ